jgi:hypothetical protein
MMTVDFADKQHDRFHDGFALRNIKLRVSRKLIYIAGLLTCFRCQLRFPDEAERIIFFKKGNELAVADLVLSALDRTPLDLAAATLYEVLGKVESVRDFFSAYNDFLGILNNPEKRDTLEKLTPDRLESDPTYAEARAVSRRFNNAVHSIFLERSNTIGELTIRYGIFQCPHSVIPPAPLHSVTSQRGCKFSLRTFSRRLSCRHFAKRYRI